jgi:hypothetical protein
VVDGDPTAHLETFRELSASFSTETRFFRINHAFSVPLGALTRGEHSVQLMVKVTEASSSRDWNRIWVRGRTIKVKVQYL